MLECMIRYGVQLATSINYTVSTLRLSHLNCAASAARLFSQEILDGSDISIPQRKDLWEAGVTLHKQLRDI